MVLRAYLDESYSTKMFTYSFLLGKGVDWLWLTSKWKAHIKETNKRLRTEGRQQISRYHASDCSNFKREFADWSQQEQIDFVKPLIASIGKYPFYTFAYSLPLNDLLALVPTDTEKALKNAYVITICFLMIDIGAKVSSFNPKVRMSLIHDRSPQDTLILDTFNSMRDDPAFRYSKLFIAMTPMGWEDCIPLQAADLCAYEAFKEAIRFVAKKGNRRRSLETLIRRGSFGITAKVITGDKLVEVVNIMKSHNKLFT